MEAVQAQVLTHYRSELVDRIRANGGVLVLRAEAALRNQAAATSQQIFRNLIRS